MKLKRALAKYLAEKVRWTKKDMQKIITKEGVYDKETQDIIYQWLLQFEDFVEDPQPKM